MTTPRLGYSNNQTVLGNAFAKLAAVLAGAALLVVAFMFSIVFFAVGITVALVLVAKVFWKTRHLRRQTREHSVHDPLSTARNGDAGRVIEGEIIRENEIK